MMSGDTTIASSDTTLTLTNNTTNYIYVQIATGTIAFTTTFSQVAAND